MWILIEVDGRHTSSNVTWRDAIDSDLFMAMMTLVCDIESFERIRRNKTYIFGAPLGSQISSHLKDGRFGSIVSNPVVVSIDNGSRHGGNQNDWTVDILLKMHLTGSSSSSQEDTSGVDIENLSVKQVQNKLDAMKFTQDHELLTLLKSSTG